MDKIKIIIVDDEEESRKGVHQLLSEDTDNEVIAVCKNGLEAIQQINKCVPDLIFLDIQMPEINGFDVLNSIYLQPIPSVIFVTAYDQYALKAFEVHALDYLLKPFTNERFYQSLHFAKKQIKNASINGINEKLVSLLKNYQEHSKSSERDHLIDEGRDNISTYAKRIVIKSSGKIIFVPLDDIIWVEAYDYYIKIHVKDQFYLVRERLKMIEKRLPPAAFARIHKSSIVNLGYIRELEHHFNGDYIVKLTNGKHLKLSRNYKDQLPGIFEH